MALAAFVLFQAHLTVGWALGAEHVCSMVEALFTDIAVLSILALATSSNARDTLSLALPEIADRAFLAGGCTPASSAVGQASLAVRLASWSVVEISGFASFALFRVS